jgi:DNA-binding GntR family transcriptional regulator
MPLVSIDLPRRRSRALEIYDVLRAAILDGTLQPGERLVEGTIATLASVSRTPVREAIRMLDADKLVRPAVDGMTVGGLNPKEFADLCIVREALEGLASRLAATSRTELDLMTLDRLMEQWHEAVTADDSAQLATLSYRFHQAIWQFAGNRYLADELHFLKQRVDTTQSTTLLAPGRTQKVTSEHEALVAAIRNRDADGAETLTREHFRGAMAIRIADDRLNGALNPVEAR